MIVDAHLDVAWNALYNQRDVTGPVAGIRAAGSVLKRGIEVLTGPALHLQYIARAEAQRIEMELAEALRDAGLHVEGGH